MTEEKCQFFEDICGKWVEDLRKQIYLMRVPLQKYQNKHVNIWMMNKSQNIRGKYQY